MPAPTLILTGSTGIAAATARLAAAAGTRLLIATGESESGWELAAETGAECWIGDLTRPGSAESVVSQCAGRFGRVDALFNAAGLSGRRLGDGPIHECTDEGWDLTFAHNLTSVFHMCRAVIARMLEQEIAESGTRGSILNMGSVLTEAPEPRHFAMHAYAAAKGAITVLSRSMAAYYAPHKIRVNVLAPGVVRTPASAPSQANAELFAFVQKKQPLTGDMVEAHDVARAALFLLSGEARPITGEVLKVDAGWGVTSA
jgi:NAD(P)-dependent dehydrogenase (short-subunit alcohol dehydrogenase family)